MSTMHLQLAVALVVQQTDEAQRQAHNIWPLYMQLASGQLYDTLLLQGKTLFASQACGVRGGCHFCIHIPTC